MEMMEMMVPTCRHAPAARAVPRSVRQPDPAVLARLPRQVPAAAAQAAARPPGHRQPQEGAAGRTSNTDTASIHLTGFTIPATLLLGVANVAESGVRGHVLVSIWIIFPVCRIISSGSIFLPSSPLSAD